MKARSPRSHRYRVEVRTRRDQRLPVPTGRQRHSHVLQSLLEEILGLPLCLICHPLCRSHSQVFYRWQRDSLSLCHRGQTFRNRNLNPRLHQDTYSSHTSCIRLYPLSPSTWLYPVSETKLSLTRRYGDIYPLVSGYKLLVRDTCMIQVQDTCRRRQWIQVDTTCNRAICILV